MARTYPVIIDELRAFIEAQQMFFVGTAPLDAAGHVNVSPKGMDCFRVLGPSEVAYLDLTGSGNETSAHVEENGRITFMFCAFEGPPSILRLYGSGATVLPGSDTWPGLLPLFPNYPGVRQIIVADISLVQTSCGFGVPLYEYQGQRDTMVRYAESQGEEKLAAYRKENNLSSMDGLTTALGAQVNQQEVTADTDI